MSRSKFTPGPWHWTYPADPEKAVLMSKTGEEICDFGDNETYYPTAGTEPNEANARLIAAAPEMLEMLMEIYEHDGKITQARYAKLFQLIKPFK